MGRTIHEIYYKRAKKELTLGGIRIDFVKGKSVYEVKTSSKYLRAARLQLLYYLYRLREIGIKVEGVLLIPRERKRLRVVLGREEEEELMDVLKGIKSIVKRERPPAPKRTPFCSKCAYNEFCRA